MVEAMRNFLFRSAWSVADKVALVVAVIAATIYLFEDHIGRIEGRVFPAADLVVDRVIETEVGVALEGVVTVLRPGCDFDALVWYVSDGVRSTPVPVTFGEGPTVREEGPSPFGPWFLAISGQELEASRADVYHRCFGRPYRVVTEIYP